MSPQTKPTCQILQPSATYTGKHAFTYFAGVSAEVILRPDLERYCRQVHNDYNGFRQQRI